MNDRELIRFLWDTGHFWNPASPETWEVREADLGNLSLRDRVVVQAVRSFQEIDANLVPLVGSFHGRGPVADGEVGPATRMLATVKRCPVPDHAPPPGIPVRHSDPGMAGVLRSMQSRAGAASGSGSWPSSGCDPERRGIHSIRVSINPAAAPSAVKAYLAQALEASRASFAEMGLAVRYIVVPATAEIVKRFESLSGSTIGWNEFPTGGCQPINGRLDSGYAPEWRMWANLEAHETGHGVGLQHTRGSIMNPSITLVWPLTWKGSPSESTLKKYFGGEPIDGTPTPPPVPPPPPAPVAIFDVVYNGTVNGRDVQLRGTMTGSGPGPLTGSLSGSVPVGIFGTGRTMELTGKATPR